MGIFSFSHPYPSEYPLYAQRRYSLLPQDGVHRPTPPSVRPRPPEVLQDILVRAAGLLQGIRQDREAFGVELAAGDIAFLVGCLGDGDNGTGKPVRGGGGVEGEAPKEATQECCLCATLP